MRSVSNGQELDEFQLYQRFRLEMVKTFGSIASALYELGANPETGEIKRDAFVEVLSNKLKLFTAEEVNRLFSHATNADPLDNGIGGTASWRSFAIKEEEWRLVVQRKRQMEEGKDTSLPFVSGPCGGSLGAFFRPVKLADAAKHFDQDCPRSGPSTPLTSTRPCHSQDGSIRAARTGGEGGDGSKTARSSLSLNSHKGVSRPQSTGRGGGKRRQPWQQPQKPWQPSLLAGGGPPLRCINVVGRSRATEHTFKIAGRSSLFDRADHAVLGDHERKRGLVSGGEAALPLAICPPSRSEMEPSLCARLS